MSNQSMAPVQLEYSDYFAFPREDQYPSITVRTGGKRRFSFYGFLNAKYVLEPQVPYFFKTELVSHGGGLFEVRLTGKEEAGGCWLSIYDEESMTNSVGDVYVRVYPRKTLHVNIFLVRDGSGQWPRTSMLAAIQQLKKINDFLRPQTGLKLVPHITDGFSIDQDTSSVPNMSSELEAAVWAEMKENSRQFDTSPSHLNLYILRNWSVRDLCVGGRCEKQVIGTAPIGGRHSIVEDLTDPTEFGNVIAHELMHSIGMTHNDDRGELALMYSSSSGGQQIFPEDILEARGEP